MPKTSDIQLSIVIVTFNNDSEIAECLRALARSNRNETWEIILVDNDSQDQTANVVHQECEKLRNEHLQTRFLLNHSNEGFTRATNQGLRLARGNYVLLLNPDTEVTENALQILMQRLSNDPGIGLIAPQLRYPDGRVQASCRHFPRRRDVFFHTFGLSLLFKRSPLFNHWKMPRFSHTLEADVDQPQGACLMTHRQALQAVGYLDERFPMFFSDVDWCRQFKERGWRILFLPDARVIHHQGASVYRNRLRMIRSSHKSFYEYFVKYKIRPVDRVLNAITGTVLLLAAFVRIGFEWLKHCMTKRAARNQQQL
ncbi:glycosyltransferase family 2 protein [candidate division KSB1 bacterium]|nr:glycosyltransferase family 2 protein [candidate division KSB1 bacterium]